MKTRAAVLHGTGQDWSVEEIEIDPPRKGEVLVKTAAAGLCHSDEHLVTGDMASSLDPDAPGIFPVIGGHEGSGVVVEIGEGVTDFAVGDHVAVSFVPACGKCRWCASGQQNLCDLGIGTMQPGMVTDGTHRHHLADGSDLNTLAKLGTFAEHMLVAADSLVKVDPELPMIPVALVSCGVATGFGSAVNRAEVGAGDTVVCGRMRRHRFERPAGGEGGRGEERRRRRPGRVQAGEGRRVRGHPHRAVDGMEAMELVAGLTDGVMADSVLLTAGVVTGDMVAPAQFLTRKGGTIVVTGLAPMVQMDVQLNLFEFAMMNKELKGTVFGSGSPRVEVPKLLSLYQAGQLKLDELVTRTYPLDDINQGYQDMRDDKNIRGVLVFD